MSSYYSIVKQTMLNIWVCFLQDQCNKLNHTLSFYRWMQYRAWIFLIWQHLSFAPVIPSCCFLPSHPVFRETEGQQICCSLFIASGFSPNSETPVTLGGFMHLIKGKIERPSPLSGFTNERHPGTPKTTGLLDWECFGKGVVNAVYKVSAQLLTGCWIDHMVI